MSTNPESGALSRAERIEALIDRLFVVDYRMPFEDPQIGPLPAGSFVPTNSPENEAARLKSRQSRREAA
jgi:hypothetical protein